jgi:hypothetical protein
MNRVVNPIIVVNKYNDQNSIMLFGYVSIKLIEEKNNSRSLNIFGKIQSSSSSNVIIECISVEEQKLDKI